MVFYINLLVFAWFWLASIVLCLVAIGWSRFGARRRLMPGVILSILALMISLLGSTHFHLTWSAWANGKPQYSYDTKWFFMGSLILAVLALGGTLIRGKRKRMKSEIVVRRLVL